MIYNSGPSIFVATPPFIQTSAGRRYHIYLDCDNPRRRPNYRHLSQTLQGNDLIGAVLGTSKFELEDWMMYLLHVKHITSRHKGIRSPALLVGETAIRPCH